MGGLQLVASRSTSWARRDYTCHAPWSLKRKERNCELHACVWGGIRIGLLSPGGGRAAATAARHGHPHPPDDADLGPAQEYGARPVRFIPDPSASFRGPDAPGLQAAPHARPPIHRHACTKSCRRDWKPKKKDTYTTEHTYFQVPTLYHIFYSAWRSNWQQLDKHGKSFRWAHFDCEEDNIPKVFAANQSRNTSDTSFISAKQTAYTGRASQAGNDSSYVHMLENHLF